MNKPATIVVCEPGKDPVRRILQPKERTLKVYQSIVGGLIQPVPAGSDPYELTCNEEGLLMGLTVQRTPFVNFPQMAGTYFITRYQSRSLTEKDLKYLEDGLFGRPIK